VSAGGPQESRPDRDHAGGGGTDDRAHRDTRRGRRDLLCLARAEGLEAVLRLGSQLRLDS